MEHFADDFALARHLLAHSTYGPLNLPLTLSIELSGNLIDTALQTRLRGFQPAIVLRGRLFQIFDLLQ